MTPDELHQVFERLARGPVAATVGLRHLYLWHGDLDALEALTPRALLQHLDLYALAGQLARTPYAADEAGRVLRSQIERGLQAQADLAQRQVLIVSGCSLLARYHVPLKPFYSFVNDSRAVVLAVPRQETELTLPTGLPGFIRLVPDSTLVALSESVGEKNVVQA